jgi:ribonuclease D
MRLRGLKQLPPAVRARARSLAVWREKVARERDLPRGWIISDAAIFKLAESAVPSPPLPVNDVLADGLLEALREASTGELADLEPGQDARPTPPQRALMDRLAQAVDARATELGVSAEILAPRGELKALAMGERAVASLAGWRREEIGTKLLELLD